jgi:hypothetical protein
MHAVILYESHHGNTAFLSRVMAATLEGEGGVHVARIDHAVEALIAEPDLLVLGGPAPDLNGVVDFLPVIERLPRAVVDRSAVVIFDTQLRHPRVWAESTASVLARAVHRLGAALILPPESFFLLTRQGPLDEGELPRAVEWAQEACARWQQRAESLAHPSPVVVQPAYVGARRERAGERTSR